MEKFELKLLLEIYENTQPLHIVSKEAVKLSKLGLTTEQIENLFNIVFGMLKNMLPDSQLKNTNRSNFDDAERENNLDKKLYCIVSFYIGSYYFFTIFPEICDQTRIRLVIEKLRSDLQGTRVPSEEEIIQRYEAMKAQQEGADEQVDLPEPQDKYTLEVLQKNLAMLRALGFE
jgi:hypothetical protein